ncbi:hypothetical protein LTS18_009793, partial [Coniosporium uncinatum]
NGDERETAFVWCAGRDDVADDEWQKGQGKEGEACEQTMNALAAGTVEQIATKDKLKIRVEPDVARRVDARNLGQINFELCGNKRCGKSYTSTSTISSMAKTKQKSLHSRAARREASPSLNLDKSLKNIPPPSNASSIPNLHAVHSGAITKPRKNKPLSRQKRIRQQKGIERADIVNDQLEKKVEKSLKRLKVVKERAKDWSDLNKKVHGQGAFAALAEDDGEGDWEDAKEEVDVVGRENEAVPVNNVDGRKPVEAIQGDVQMENPVVPANPVAVAEPAVRVEEDEIT